MELLVKQLAIQPGYQKTIAKSLVINWLGTHEHNCISC